MRRKVMDVLVRAIVWVGLFFALMPTQVLSQTSTVDSGKGQGQKVSGIIRGVVFSHEAVMPVAGLTVALRGGESVVTGSDGAFEFSAPAGQYTLVVTQGATQHRQPVVIVASQATEVIVTVYKDARAAKFDIEAPEGVGVQNDIKAAVFGRAAGTVLSLETKKPIAGARVFVRGAAAEAKTNRKGEFNLKLPVGTYDLSLVHPDHSTQSVPGVTIKEGEVFTTTVTMAPAAVELEEFAVSAPRITGGTAAFLDERRNSAAVSDVLGSERMSKSGDSSAASALTRVTGITLVDDKYIYVRGLGDRYSSAQLNGSTLPSPEPERRVIPLDVFPTGILEGIVIPKTYTADMPGEFGGGTIQLRTKPIPEERVRKISLSTGAELQTTFQQGLTYQGSNTDFLGIDSGARSLPNSVAAASENSPLKETDRFSSKGYTSEELEAFGEQVSNNWAVNRQNLPPSFGMSGAIGDKFELGSSRLGYLGSVTYSNAWDNDNRERTYYLVGANDELEVAHDYDFATTENAINLGGILALGAEFSKFHQISATTTAVRQTTNEARIYEGLNTDVDTDIRVTRLRWIERMLLAQQISGKHQFGKDYRHLLNWRYTFALANRHEPDRREYRYDREESTMDLYRLSDRPEGNQRVFSDLNDYNHDIGLDYTMPLPWISDWNATLKVGSNAVIKDRTVDTRRYKFLHQGPRSNDQSILSMSPEEIFVPENIGPDGFQFEEITRQTDNYSALQRIYAGYALADISFGKPVRLVAGARAEHSTQQVDTFALFTANDELVRAKLANTDILPSAALSWSVVDSIALRAAAARTVTRPEFRELSPATFNDVTGGRQIFGNPELKRGTINHLDVRAEWYPSPTEVVSIGGFVKDFQDPIEQIVVVSAQLSITYANATAARNYGFEAEMRKWLGFISPKLSDFYVSGNVALISSRVDLEGQMGIQTSETRALQGQSPYVVNAEIGYNQMEKGLYATLLYNVFGRRITQVGALGAPDIYEEPVHRLDFSAGMNFDDGWAVTAKARNLINPKAIRTQGGEITEVFRRGRSLSLGLSKTF